MSDFSLKESYKNSLNLLLECFISTVKTFKQKRREKSKCLRSQGVQICPVLVNIICQMLLVEMSLHRPGVKDQLEVKGHSQCDVTKHGHGSYY